jgi:glycine cleavage system H protein
MKYTESHEWIETDGRVGISTHAQKELGEIVHVELPEVGRHVEAGEEIAVIESTKAAADIYTPVSGVVTAVNEDAKNNPALINSDPEGKGWLYQMEVSKPLELEDLLAPETYAEHTS